VITQLESAAFCHIEDVRCEANLQQLWRQVFCSCRPEAVDWNSLPSELRQADISFQRFKRLLKTFLFGCWDRGALWLTVKAAPHKFSYLLTYLFSLTFGSSMTVHRLTDVLLYLLYRRPSCREWAVWWRSSGGQGRRQMGNSLWWFVWRHWRQCSLYSARPRVRDRLT